MTYTLRPCIIAILNDGDRPSGALNRVRHQLNALCNWHSYWLTIFPYTHIGHIMNYHTKTPIDISSFKGTVKVLKPRKVKRHNNPNRIKCPGVRLTWKQLIAQARKA